MAVRNLEKFFRPERIALIRSGRENDGVLTSIVRNVSSSGFAGEVYIVDRERKPIQGFESFPCVAKLPNAADLAVVCAPAAEVPQIVRECGDSGIGGVLVTSGGFREIGPAGRDLELQMLGEAARFEGLRILGPRSIGLLVPHLNLNASLAASQPKPGRVAFVSQSGTLCTSALDLAIEEEIGFSYFVSIGNALEVTVGDLIDYFAADPYTDSIILFLESISDARQFM
jgi:acetyltransferase